MIYIFKKRYYMACSLGRRGCKTSIVLQISKNFYCTSRSSKHHHPPMIWRSLLFEDWSWKSEVWKQLQVEDSILKMTLLKKTGFVFNCFYLGVGGGKVAQVREGSFWKCIQCASVKIGRLIFIWYASSHGIPPTFDQFCKKTNQF